MQLRRDTSKGVVKVLDGIVCLDTALFSALLSMLPYNDIGTSSPLPTMPCSLLLFD